MGYLYRCTFTLMVSAIYYNAKNKSEKATNLEQIIDLEQSSRICSNTSALFTGELSENSNHYVEQIFGKTTNSGVELLAKKSRINSEKIHRILVLITSL